MINAGFPVVGIGAWRKGTGKFTFPCISKAAGLGTVRDAVIVIVKGNCKTLYLPAEQPLHIVFVVF